MKRALILILLASLESASAQAQEKAGSGQHSGERDASHIASSVIVRFGDSVATLSDARLLPEVHSAESSAYARLFEHSLPCYGRSLGPAPGLPQKTPTPHCWGLQSDEPIRVTGRVAPQDATPHPTNPLRIGAWSDYPSGGWLAHVQIARISGWSRQTAWNTRHVSAYRFRGGPSGVWWNAYRWAVDDGCIRNWTRRVSNLLPASELSRSNSASLVSIEEGAGDVRVGLRWW
ncbi:hypothetical protein DHODJN_25335 [Methylorubrum extorquens]